MMAGNILADYGFEPEMAGGGCYVLSRYFDSGAAIWVTGMDGTGLPAHGDWLFGVYPDLDSLGMPAWDAYASDFGAASIFDAAQAAIAAAQAIGANDGGH